MPISRYDIILQIQFRMILLVFQMSLIITLYSFKRSFNNF